MIQISPSIHTYSTLFGFSKNIYLCILLVGKSHRLKTKEMRTGIYIYIYELMIKLHASRKDGFAAFACCVLTLDFFVRFRGSGVFPAFLGFMRRSLMRVREPEKYYYK